MQSSPEIPRRAWIIAVVASASTFLFVADSGLLSIAFPQLSTEFSSANRATLSWAFTGYAVVMAALMAYAGNLADRVGRKRVFLGGLAVYIVGATLTALAPSAGLLICARLVQGAGAAFFSTSALALMLVEFPTERRATALSTNGIIGSIGAIITPTLGAAMLERWSWRWAFGSIAALALVALIAGSRLLTDSRSDTAIEAPDTPSVLIGAIGVGLITLALSRGTAWGWLSPKTLGTLMVGACLLPIVVRRSRVSTRPLIPPLVMAERGYRLLTLAAIVQQIGFFGYYFSLPLILTGVWEWSALNAGYAMAGSMLVSAVVAPISGRIADRRGYEGLLLVGCALTAAAAAWWLLNFRLDVRVVAALVPGLVLQGIGSCIVGNLTTGAALRSVPAGLMASANSLHQMARRVGGALGVALVIALLGESRLPAELLIGARRVWVLLIVVHAAMVPLVVAAHRSRIVTAQPVEG